ncbi:MAG: hypothetical protein Q7U33_02125 [Methylotenera sp.]|jgi:hypothetical protein|uniref:hypothetical protein n=1 Tax=Methylotenera sp. TaxID=2051956 RepID=UPI00271B1946|nr:hypothetical protein [Methylotenera sp.]MDO9150157.1 hypothetical protein [Methylotenera sp.]
MKALNLVAIVSSAVLLVAGAAHAESNYKSNAHNQNFISKRPYQQVVTKSDQKKDQQWEGATLIEDEAKVKVGSKNRNASRINKYAE